MWTRREEADGMDDENNRIGSSDHRIIGSSGHLGIGTSSHLAIELSMSR
jgi:hypothetical protein